MAAGTPAVEDLERSAEELGRILTESSAEVEALAREFQSLEQETGTLLEQARAIVACAEEEASGGLGPRVEALGRAVRQFLEERLRATAALVETVTAEAVLVKRLGDLTRGQKSIVRETEMLRLLTNIEVARLGEVGGGFRYLAQELEGFAQEVAQSIAALAAHTDERTAAIEQLQRTLRDQLPRAREEYTRLAEGLAEAAAQTQATLATMREAPARFRSCVEEIAGQIPGVVAGIQAHDITRQQMEHVQAALGALAAELRAAPVAGDGTELRAGLTIQSYQTQSLRATAGEWTGQIRRCLEGMARIATAEVAEVGPQVLAQERALEAQLGQMERLEEACRRGNEQVRASAEGVAGLMQLVREHLARSKTVRDRLQLLMFNSIVEARHLGTQADGILEISTSIQRIAAAWNQSTGQSEATMGEMAALVAASGTTLEAFSAGCAEGLAGAQEETRRGLGSLRATAMCVEQLGREIEGRTARLQGGMAAIGGRCDRLESSLERLGGILATIDAAREALGAGIGTAAGGNGQAIAEAVERKFGAGYTTERERAVLHAALVGGPLPAMSESLAGNGVELF